MMTSMGVEKRGGTDIVNGPSHWWPLHSLVPGRPIPPPASVDGEGLADPSRAGQMHAFGWPVSRGQPSRQGVIKIGRRRVVSRLAMSDHSISRLMWVGCGGVVMPSFPSKWIGRGGRRLPEST
jgi:hypothetical protein